MEIEDEVVAVGAEYAQRRQMGNLAPKLYSGQQVGAQGSCAVVATDFDASGFNISEKRQLEVIPARSKSAVPASDTTTG